MSKGGTTVSFAYGPERARYKKSSTKDGNTEITYYLGKFFEKVIKADGSTYEYKHYITGEDKAIAIHVQNGYYDGRVETPHDQTRYLHHDHLGSVDTITSSTGVIIERQSYDAFGKRREGNWRAIDPYAIDIQAPTYTKRGYTGHEHIDELDLIHMNGRVYDPTLGRFLSADPHIQSPNHSQSHNRYSYVLNNPLKYTDPSGFFFKELQKFMHKHGRMVVGLAIGAIVGYHTIVAFAGGAQATAGMLFKDIVVQAGVGGNFVAGAAGGAISGAMAPDATPGSILKSALLAGVRAAVSFGIGQAGFGEGVAADLAKDFTHGVAQGLVSVLDDGDFAGGFFGAFAGHLAGRTISQQMFGGPGMPNLIGRTAVAAIVGGTAAEIGGGKFANGAVSAAFSHLFNNESNRLISRSLLATLSDPLVDRLIKGIKHEAKRFMSTLERKPDYLTFDVIINPKKLIPFAINIEGNIDKNGQIYVGLGSVVPRMLDTRPLSLTINAGFINGNTQQHLAGGEWFYGVVAKHVLIYGRSHAFNREGTVSREHGYSTTEAGGYAGANYSFKIGDPIDELSW